MAIIASNLSLSKKCEQKLEGMRQMLQLIAAKSESDELIYMCEVTKYLTESLESDLKESAVIPHAILDPSHHYH